MNKAYVRSLIRDDVIRDDLQWTVAHAIAIAIVCLIHLLTPRSATSVRRLSFYIMLCYVATSCALLLCGACPGPEYYYVSRKFSSKLKYCWPSRH